MKSKKAKEYINSLEFTYLGVALHAALLAEAEMRERAIEAHKKVCEWYKDGICMYAIQDNYDCEGDCYYTEDFIKDLDNPKPDEK